MEHDVLVVAVALRADGLAQQRIVALVVRKAGELRPVRAVLRRRGRMARPGPGLGPRVHGAEGRGCQRREDHRVGGDRLRHSLPAGEACHDEVAGVVAVDVRARRATGLAPVAARLEDETLVSTVVGDLARGGVDVVLVPKEADWVRAVVGLAGLRLERVEAAVESRPRQHRLDELGRVAPCRHVRKLATRCNTGKHDSL